MADKSLEERKRRFIEKYDGTDPAESYIEKRWNRIGEKHGWLNRKLSTPGRRGPPDRGYWRTYDGVSEHFMIEFKRSGKPLSPTQVIEHEKLRKAGVTILVIDHIDDELAHAVFL